MNITKKKIILHNLTFRGIEAVPGILDFDQRGIVYLNNGDVIITKSKVEEIYLKYLENLGWNFSRCLFFHTKDIKNYSYNSIFYKKEIVAKMKSLKGYYLDTYNTTFEEYEFARKINKPLYANCFVSQEYGTKSGFRTVAKKIGLRVAHGFEHIVNIKDLFSSVDKLLNEGVSEIVVKIDEGISGAGTTKIKAEYFKKKSVKEQKKILQSAFSKINQSQNTSGVIVEEWLQNVTSSPSVQIEVYPDKKWRIVSIHDQLLEGEEQWYIGCRYPQQSLNKKQLKLVLKDVQTFIQYLLTKNFIGFLGLDLVITDKNEIYWIEANMRKPGTFYPRIIAEKLNHGTLRGVFYIACDFTIPSYKAKSFSFIREQLRPFLYPIQGEKYGIVVYNAGALQASGRFDVVCMGRSEKEAQKIFTRTKDYIYTVKDRKEKR